MSRKMSDEAKARLRDGARAKREANRGRGALKSYDVFGFGACVDEVLAQEHPGTADLPALLTECGFLGFTNDPRWPGLRLRCGSNGLRFFHDPNTEAPHAVRGLVRWVSLKGATDQQHAMLGGAFGVRAVRVQVFAGVGLGREWRVAPVYPADRVLPLFALLWPWSLLPHPVKPGWNSAVKRIRTAYIKAGLWHDATAFVEALTKYVTGYTDAYADHFGR